MVSVLDCLHRRVVEYQPARGPIMKKMISYACDRPKAHSQHRLHHPLHRRQSNRSMKLFDRLKFFSQILEAIFSVADRRTSLGHEHFDRFLNPPSIYVNGRRKNTQLDK